MDRVAVRTLNQHTTEVVARVERGEVVEVTNRGRPVARMVPVSDSGMADLVAAGVVQPPTITGPIPLPVVAAEPGPEAGELVSGRPRRQRWHSR